MAPGFEQAAKAHDAGFDAFCTGSVFLRCCQLLRVKNMEEVFQDPLLDMYRNRIAVAGRKMPVRLDADTPTESREDVFVLEKTCTVAPETLKAALEHKYGKVALYKVYWSESLMYVIPSSLESRERLLAAATQPIALELGGVIATLSSYDHFVRSQGWKS